MNLLSEDVAQHRLVRRRELAGVVLCTVCFYKYRICLRHPAQKLRLRQSQLSVFSRGSDYGVVTRLP